MKTEIIFAGFGGQGILLMGKILAQSVMTEGKNVSYLPSYGPEMRGGTCNCSVVISDEQIASPIIDNMNILVAMNQPSFLKFSGSDRISDGGTIFVNESLVEFDKKTETDFLNRKIEIVKGPFTKLASDIGNIRICNMVAIGKFIKKTKLASKNVVIEQMKELTEKFPEFQEMNEKAINAGFELK